ncbi:SoxR reducing system RseC family protein [Microbulbifer aggregans]|uniref:SoxR reducing system RseC family protein n=1 Tax=Microbulbifer aggregans TaxID=1769779 RepID=UPI001CFEA70E|nr:SoxR reducing system RseC family protein [Microbulbifer aggregans]
MIEERGRVVALGQDGIWVETVQRSSCHGCAAKSGCGTGLLGDFWSNTSRIHVPVAPRQLSQLALHDTVVIGISENTLASSALIVYLLPLVGMLAGAQLGNMLAAEPGAIIVALAGLVGGGIGVRWFGSRNRNNPAMVPQLLRLEHSQPCSTPAG